MPSISQADVEEGIRLALENANRLYQDAMLLHKEKRYRSSIGLSVFALGEVGKMLMLVQDWRRGQGCSLRDWSKGGKYLVHYNKLQAAGRITYILNPEAERKHNMELSKRASTMSATSDATLTRPEGKSLRRTLLDVRESPMIAIFLGRRHCCSLRMI